MSNPEATLGSRRQSLWDLTACMDWCFSTYPTSARGGYLRWSDFNCSCKAVETTTQTAQCSHGTGFYRGQWGTCQGGQWVLQVQRGGAGILKQAGVWIGSSQMKTWSCPKIFRLVWEGLTYDLASRCLSRLLVMSLYLRLPYNVAYGECLADWPHGALPVRLHMEPWICWTASVSDACRRCTIPVSPALALVQCPAQPPPLTPRLHKPSVMGRLRPQQRRPAPRRGPLEAP
jgi:hypothetical protein